MVASHCAAFEIMPNVISKTGNQPKKATNHFAVQLPRKFKSIIVFFGGNAPAYKPTNNTSQPTNEQRHTSCFLCVNYNPVVPYYNHPVPTVSPVPFRVLSFKRRRCDKKCALRFAAAVYRFRFGEQPGAIIIAS